MSHILLITSSPRVGSYSTKVARSLADKLASRSPDTTVVVRDLVREPLPHIDDRFVVARAVAPENVTAVQRAALTVSDMLVKELFEADTIIIAASMINFGIPSNLKAYIDYVVRPGVTFKYSEKGPEGLIKGKKLYLVLARGGVYTHGPMQQLNFQDPYLRTTLGFIGLSDVEVITVEGVAFGPEAAERAVKSALEQASALAA